jgi:hypothetical protein
MLYLLASIASRRSLILFAEKMRSLIQYKVEMGVRQNEDQTYYIFMGNEEF